jgi:CPA1 family monovalent cation:H+ antiporter
MSENTRRRLDDLWRFLGFAANGLLFLLVGFTVNPAGLLGHLGPVAVAVVAVFVSRAVVIALVTPASRRVLRSAEERALLVWGGLRGALTVALALALPAETPERDLIAAMAFGVVLFSMVGQGLTLPLLVRRLGVGSGVAAHG